MASAAWLAPHRGYDGWPSASRAPNAVREHLSRTAEVTEQRARRVAIHKAKLIRAERSPAYLPNKPAGLIGTAGGVQVVVNSMDYIARALHGWSVPLVVPVAQSW